MIFTFSLSLMTLTSNITPVKQPANYPFRIATIDDPKTQEEMLHEASIASAVAELKDIESKLGKKRSDEEYVTIMRQVAEWELTIDDVEKQRIAQIPKMQTPQEQFQNQQEVKVFIKKMGADWLERQREVDLVIIANQLAGSDTFTRKGLKQTKIDYITEQVGL